MPKSEKRIEQEIQLEAAKHDCTLFKNNVGTAFRGTQFTIRSPVLAKLLKRKIGSRIMLDLQIIRYGLGGVKGGSDQIGMTKVRITEDMVGKDIAIFTSIEVKKDKHGAYKATKEQKAWIKMVLANGGFAGVADCIEDMKELIGNL